MERALRSTAGCCIGTRQQPFKPNQKKLLEKTSIRKDDTDRQAKKFDVGKDIFQLDLFPEDFLTMGTFSSSMPSSANIFSSLAVATPLMLRGLQTP